jgi:hypothetical protein
MVGATARQHKRQGFLLTRIDTFREEGIELVHQFGQLAEIGFEFSYLVLRNQGNELNGVVLPADHEILCFLAGDNRGNRHFKRGDQPVPKSEFVGFNDYIRIKQY